MMIKKSFLCIVLFLTPCLLSYNQRVVTCIVPRSQSFNTARTMAGWEFVTHRTDKLHESYYTFALIPEITRSFRPERINQCLFGDDIITRATDETEWADSLTISGSRTENRTRAMDWLADYFGLPTDFESSVLFRPRVNNFILDGHLFCALNSVTPGLYIELDLPLVYTNWDLNIREIITAAGTNSSDPGYFNATGIPRQNLLSSFSEFISGSASPQINNLTFQPLQFSKMSLHHLKLVCCAELRAYLGYDFFIHEHHHIGLTIEGAIPCGNHQKGEFLFEPFVGNGKHWELGAGFTAHLFAWENSTTDERVDFFADGNVTHLFSNHQRRTFDLCAKPNSRYMLAEKITPPIVQNLTGTFTTPIGQYKSEVAPVANLTTFDVTVSTNAQAELALTLAYTKSNFTWTFGYSAWKRSGETIIITNPETFQGNTWALKGDASVFGFVAEQINPTDLAAETPVALSATQSAATINTGTNMASYGLMLGTPQEQENQIAVARRNPHIDLPQPAFAGNHQYLVASLDNLTIVNQVNTTIQPIFIQFSDININSASTSGFINKIFGHFNHIWHTKWWGTPYFGFGAEVDFAKQAGPSPAIGDDISINCQISYWGIWLKGGISF